jgi:hypothetical protein
MHLSFNTFAFIVSSAFVSACGSSAHSHAPAGLSCKSGSFYLDGQAFTSCDQCTSTDCKFEFSGDQTCTYPNGVQRCSVENGTETAHCAGEVAILSISDGNASCEGSAPGGGSGGSDNAMPSASGGSSGAGASGSSGVPDLFGNCTFPDATSSQPAAAAPTLNNSADLSGTALGDVAFAPDGMRRSVPVEVDQGALQLELGDAYLTRADDGETAYVTIPVKNGGTGHPCFIEAMPFQWLAADGTVLNDSTQTTFVYGSVGDMGSGIFTDTCLGPGESGYLIDIEISTGEPFFSGTASIKLGISSSRSGTSSAGHLVPQEYDVGTCSGQRSMRAVALNDGSAPVALTGSTTGSLVVFLDADAVPAGWTFFENQPTLTVGAGESATFFTFTAEEPDVTRARFLVSFDSPTAKLELGAPPAGGPAADERRAVAARLATAAGWRALVSSRR